jgi:hypothetical protein
MTILTYQAIDLLLGKHGCAIPPVAGFVVTVPDAHLGARMFLTLEEAERGLAELKSLSRWPNSLFIRPAWIHEQDVVFGQVSNRRHWTLR